MAGGGISNAGRKKPSSTATLSTTLHVDFIRLSAKSFIIRLIRNSINAGKRFLSSDIYSFAGWVQAIIYI